MAPLCNDGLSVSVICADDTHRDGGQETFGDIGDDDPDEEDDCVQPEISEDEGDDEEGDPEEDGNGGYEVDEVLDLPRNRRLSRLQTGCQVGDSTHDSTITCADHDPSTGA